MFDVFLVLFVPIIFGLGFIGIFVGGIVFIITYSVRAAKKEADEIKFKEFSHMERKTDNNLETKKCEYCGSIIEKGQLECYSCGAKATNEKK